MARGRQQSIGEWDIAKELGYVDKDETTKLKDVTAVMSKAAECPDRHTITWPTAAQYAEKDLFFDVNIARAEKIVAKRRQEKEDFVASKTPEGKARNEFKKAKEQMAAVMAKLAEYDIDPASVE